MLFKEPVWLGLNASERLAFLEKGECPGRPLTPLNVLCRNEWMHYLISYVQPWEPLNIVLDYVNNFVQTQNRPVV